MHSSRRESLGRFWKLAPWFAGAAAILLLIAGIFVVYTGETSYRRGKLDETVVQARILASTVIAPLTFDDRTAAETYVGALAANPAIEAAAVYDAEGQPFAIFRRSDQLAVPAPATAEVRQAGTIISASRHQFCRATKLWGGFMCGCCLNGRERVTSVTPSSAC